jgi:putative transcriptional regulator
MTILELRKKTGLSQSQFAKRFHLNVRTVQTWEQGTRKTPDYVIWLITRVIELEEIINVKRDGI